MPLYMFAGLMQLGMELLVLGVLALGVLALVRLMAEMIVRWPQKAVPKVPAAFQVVPPRAENISYTHIEKHEEEVMYRKEHPLSLGGKNDREE